MKSTIWFIGRFSFVCILYSCFASCNNSNKYNKNHHLYTKKLDANLYLESYKVDSYGVGGDVYSLYLTDSIEYRKFVTLYYDAETFESTVNGNLVTITKMESIGGYDGIELSSRKVDTYLLNRRELELSKKMN